MPVYPGGNTATPLSHSLDDYIPVIPEAVQRASYKRSHEMYEM